MKAWEIFDDKIGSYDKENNANWKNKETDL